MKNKSNEQYEKDILEIIEKNRIFNIVDIFAFYKGCSRATFYNQGLDKLDTIKEALENNKILTKQTLKQKWFKSDNPTLQIALFKTLANNDELKALNGLYHDHTTKGDKIKNVVFTYEDLEGEDK